MFQETMYRKEKSAPDINKSTVISRTAVRAVILNNKKLLMAHLGKTNEYKFPGGGKEAHETIDDAIQREVLEEVGYTVEKINGKIGEIIEYDRAREGGGAVFKMVSEYYSAEVNGIPAGQNLEDYGACCKSRLLLHRLLQFFALRAAKLHFSAVAVAKLKFCNSLYEKDLLFSPCRVEIEEAYNTNMARINNGDETTSGIKRETRVLALLKEIYGNQGR